jgi:hypothetical protein
MALKLNLKAAAARSASVTKPAHTATAEATKYRDLAIRMDELKAELEVARDELLGIVDAEKDAKVRAGEEVTSIKVPTDDGNRVLVVYTEKFKHLDIENVGELKAAFGADYTLVVEEHETLTFNAGVSIAAIEKAIGKPALTKLTALLSVKESVTPRKGAVKECSRLFREGETEKGEDLLTLLEATLYSPQVRAK